MDEYWSDASDTSSEEEDEIDSPEVWCYRELEYWKIEDIMLAHTPPPVLEYMLDIGTFHVRESAVLPLMDDPREVMDSISANNWFAFWQYGRENTEAAFSFEDFDAMCEYCLMICEAVHGQVSTEQLQSCILHLLRHGKFI